MSDTSTPNPADSTDDLDASEDAREETQVNTELEDSGLLPLPDATPADGPAPGA